MRPTVEALRRLSAPQLAVLACAGLAAVAALIHYPAALSELSDIVRDNSTQSYADREIAGGNAVIPDQALAYAARAIIPETESYEVVLGEPSEDWSELTAQHAPGWLRYFLMPRRQVVGASWVVCLRCDRAALGAEAVWEGDAGLAILRRAA